MIVNYRDYEKIIESSGISEVSRILVKINVSLKKLGLSKFFCRISHY